MSIFVKKIGGSLLRSVSDFAKIADYLSKFYERGDQLVVVVSAQYGTTDGLIKQAMQYSPCQGAAYELLLSVGEQHSCALMGLALQNLGVPSKIFCGFQMGIHKTKEGFFSIDTGNYREALKKGIIIIGGFQAVDSESNLVNLGRGGSDLTALLIAESMKVDRCELIKDVPGIFNLNNYGQKVDAFYKTITFNDLKRLSKLRAFVVQPQALDFAIEKQYSFWVTDLRGVGTEVGHAYSEFRPNTDNLTLGKNKKTLSQVAF